MRDHRPPGLARALLRALLPPTLREFVTGDLDEEFQIRLRANQPPRNVRRWYWSQSVRSVFQSRRHETPVRKSLQRPRRTPRGGLVQSILFDIRYAVRTFLRTPGFTILALLTLALGIGATTSIFSAVNQVVLQPLPFAEPDRLVMLWESNEERGWQQVHAAPANVMDWRERVGAFADIAMINEFTTDVGLSGRDEAVQVVISQVSGNAFSVLGVPPMLGRTFTMKETWAGTAPIVVLSHAAWQRYFGGDPDVVGQTIRLDGMAFEVVGVMGPEFRYMFNDAEIWMPYYWSEELRNGIWFRQAHVVRAVGRLAPGFTYEQARQELTTVARQLQDEHPQTNRAMEAGLTPLQHFVVGDRRITLFLLLGAVGVLQLIACANVANLLMTRSATRKHEIAIRSALGAGRRRIIRQVFTESLVLALAGTLVGLAIGVAGLAWISSLRPPELPALSFRIDWRLATFTAALAGVSTVLFGAVPATRSARTNAADHLTDGSRIGQMDRRSRVLTSGLVVLEIGLAVVLVVGAGLMIRSMRELHRVDAGIDMTNVLTFEFTPPSGKYPSGRERADLIAQALDALRGLPGVVEAGGVRRLPYQGSAWTSDFTIEGWGPDAYGTEVRHREATPGYYRAMGIPVLSGTLYEARLAPNQRVPVVVNRSFVRRYFEDQSPIGRRIAFDRTPGDNSYWYDIVGVVGDERMSVTEEPAPEIIAHIRGDTPRTTRIVLKTSVPPMSLVPAVRETLAALDNEIPLVNIRTMADVAAGALASDRFLTTLMSVFAAAALILASVGVYGVSAQAARSRTREIGIRIALGAPGRRILNDFVVRGVTVALIGVAAGLAGAIAGSQVMAGLIYGVTATDPVTLGTVAGLLGIVAIGSGLGPALRATRLDPVTVLKTD